MKWGRFEKKMIASAKLASLEKYGFTYNEDLDMIEECMYPEVRVEHLDNEGHIKVICSNGRQYEAYVKNYIPKRSLCQPKANSGEIIDAEAVVVPRYGSAGDEDRRGKYVSVWDTEKH